GWNADYSAVVGSSAITAAADGASLAVAPPGNGSPTIADFTIAPGPGQPRSQPLPGRYGGGVLVEGGAPVLADLVIEGANVGSGSELGCGGAIALIDTEATVTGAILAGNRATWGGGVFVQGGAPVLEDLTITGSVCNPGAGGQDAQGAGVLVRESSATLVRCEIRGGRGAVRGGGLAWLGARNRQLTLEDCVVVDNTMDQDGGGLYGQDGAITISGGLLAENRPAPDATFASGGGAYLTRMRATIDGLVVRDNAAAAGGGITVNEGPQVDVTGSVFGGNEADLFGAALNYQRNDAGEIARNTMADNVNPPDAGVLHLVGCSPPLSGNLIAFNTGGGVAGVNATPIPSCNDVHGNGGANWIDLADPTGSDGNLDVDPLFCDLPGGDLTLRDDSPCLDAPGCGLIGALGQGCEQQTAAPAVAAGPAVRAYPNPANPAATVRFELPRAATVRLTLHDARGRRLRTLASGPHPAGIHEVRLDGRDAAGRALASGIYLTRLATDREVVQGRLTLLR
ncbi:hypothetical protein GF314_15580, partial [bacterium]|nr:hypothetical protein [bacterium]